MTLVARLTFLAVLLLGCSRATAEGVTPFGEVLLWHASQETSSIWASAIAKSGSEHTFSAENVDFGWDPGFRVGVAHDPGRQSWDTELAWTHWGTSAQSSIRAGEAFIMPEFFSSFVNLKAWYVDRAAVRWDITLNQIDFEIGRAIAVGQSASVRPTMGLRAAFIDQKIRADWDTTFGSFSVTERIEHQFRGLGPTFGIDGRWQLSHGRNLSLVGSFSGSLLWGVWNVEDTYARNDTGFSLPAYGGFTTSMKDSSLGTANLNAFLGLQWIHGGVCTIAGRVGYELQWWANQQRLTAFQQLPMHGDLTIQGLTCGLAVGF
jgi:hypothetical protein